VDPNVPPTPFRSPSDAVARWSPVGVHVVRRCGSYHPGPVKPQTDDIAAPLFPRGLTWVNTAPLRMDKQIRRTVLIDFWDFCRPSSVRTLPYLEAWHRKYTEHGLRVISVHAPGYAAGLDEDAVTAAVARLGLTHPVMLDTEHELWLEYGNQGWPARYLWNGRLRLVDYHYGEGAYDETERAIQEQLGLDEDLVPVVRPEDDPEALIVVPSEGHEGPWSGPYAAGGAWGAFAGTGTIVVNGTEVSIDWPGARPLVEHPHHTEAVLDLQVGPGVECLAVHFTPGVVAPD